MHFKVDYNYCKESNIVVRLSDSCAMQSSLRVKNFCNYVLPPNSLPSQKYGVGEKKCAHTMPTNITNEVVLDQITPHTSLEARIFKQNLSY